MLKVSKRESKTPEDAAKKVVAVKEEDKPKKQYPTLSLL